MSNITRNAAPGETPGAAGLIAAIIRERSAGEQLISGPALRRALMKKLAERAAPGAAAAARMPGGCMPAGPGYARIAAAPASGAVPLVARRKGAKAKVPAVPPPDFDAALASALAGDPDLAVVTGPDGTALYHARSEMSATYAAIMAGKSDLSYLMADTVRANSREYPRPVPLDMFEYPPFDFRSEDIQACLKNLGQNPAYADISFVESSVGSVYLYSETYLERDYAAFLAERADVGMVMNP